MLHPNDEANQNRWIMIHQNLLEERKIESLVSSLRSIETCNAELAHKARSFAPRLSILGGTPSACVIQSFADSTCSWAQASLRPGARR